MKKIILILMFLIIITGCGNNKQNNTKKKDDVTITIGEETFKLKSKRNLKDIQYLENYVDFHTDAMGNNRIMNYYKNNELVFEIRVIYDEVRSFEEIKKSINHEESKKTINGIEYSFFNYQNTSGNIIHLYTYNHKNTTYSIMFTFKNELPELENTFMDNIKYNW